MTAKNSVVKGLQKALEAQNEIVLAWVFGSFASEKQKPTSDLDVAVATRSLKHVV